MTPEELDQIRDRAKRAEAAQYRAKLLDGAIAKLNNEAAPADGLLFSQRSGTSPLQFREANFERWLDFPCRTEVGLVDEVRAAFLEILKRRRDEAAKEFSDA